MALTLLLACALMAGLAISASAWSTYQGEVVDPATDKPIVTIQGNLVYENGKPTGFYELALCVQSGYDYRDTATGTIISRADYAQKAADSEDVSGYEPYYYPFHAATAAVNINTDILTAVNWDLQSVTYANYDSAQGSYDSNNTGYPWGINTDPNFQGYTMPVGEAFPNITTPNFNTNPSVTERSVALDVEGDTRMATIAALAEHYDAESKTAIVTLTAAAPDNNPVILRESTPLVVARFSYDLKRFNATKVLESMNSERGSVTGEQNGPGFWMGWDKTTGRTGTEGLNDKQPLTWLGESTGTYDFTASDALIAQTRNNQSVWVQMGTEDPLVNTHFYFYLAAETDLRNETDDIQVAKGAVPEEVNDIPVPKTEGERVLTEAKEDDPYSGSGYTFFKNLLMLKEKTLVIQLVNQPSFKQPTGGYGGNQILFYDWDDTLIGALIVGDGDVRAEVNAYVEQNLVHPDLRAGDVLAGKLGGTVPDFSNVDSGSDAETYKNLISSLNREYTYRGSYSSTPDGNGQSYAEEGQEGYDPDWAGSSYPLTNKLDYAFYRHLNTVTSIDTANTAGNKLWTENYFTVNSLTEDELAAQYPWTYGWAIVEDGANSMKSMKADWPVMVDSVKLESTWTTFGVGELENMDPSAGNTQSTFAGTVINSEVTYPGGLTTDWSTDPNRAPSSYTYKTSTADANGYLRFADFSDMSAMLENGQNVLIVKATYEPGTSLDLNGYYSVVEGSLNVYRLGTASSAENSIYAFEYQYERVNDSTGQVIGVGRTRDPAVRTGFVFDAKAVDTNEDLDAQSTFFLKNIGDNTDVMDIQLTTGGALWKLEYTLLDIYGLDISNGAARSLGGELELKTGFEYDKPDGSGEWDYDDRQGTDGFVVEATLNTLLTEATKEAREPGSGNLAGHVSLNTLQDLNFKRNTNPDDFTVANIARFRTYLQDLVTRLYRDKKSIDPKTGNVVLGWHQIQQHILLCEAAGGAVDGIYSGGVLKSETECIGIGYEWCRLDTCGSNATMPINSFQDVLKALEIISKGEGDPNYKPAQKAIYGEDGNGGVTGADLYGYGFRRHADGVPYDANDPNLKTTILADLQAAATSIAAADWSTVTWDRVQVEIIKHRMGGSAPATLNAWWKPTSYNPPAITNWSDWLKYSYQAYVGVDTTGNGTPDAKVPDAFDAYKKVSKTLLDAMIKEHVHGNATGEYADMGWLRASVDESGECVEFTSVEQFATAWKAAIEALSKPAPSGGGYNTVALLKSVSWEELQYAVLTGSYKTRNDIMAGVTAGDIPSLYWNDGGQPKLTFERLLEAINKAFGEGDASELNKILSKGIDPINNELYLRKSEGAFFTDQADFEQALYNVITALRSNTNNGGTFWTGSGLNPDTVDIYVLQYLIINYGSIGGSAYIPSSDEIQADSSSNNYWWFDGGAPSGPMPIRNIRELFTAYFWTKGTSHGVSAENPDALNDLTVDIMTSLGLRSDDWGIPYSSAVNSELVAKVSAALDLMCPVPYSAATLSSASDANLLKELQYALIHGSYLPASSIGETYWWQGGTYPPVSDQASLLENAYKAYVGNDDGEMLPEAEDALKAMTADFVNDRTKKGIVGLAMRNSAKGDNFPSNINVFLGKLETVVENLHSMYGLSYADMKDITQYQLQYFLLDATGTSWGGGDSHGLKTDEEIKGEIIGTTGDYWWFTSDTDPNAGGPTRKEKPIDEDAFKQFLEDVGNYMAYYITDSFDLGLYTEATLASFNLQNTDGMGGATPFTDISEFMDYSMGDMAATVYYALLNEGYYDADGATLLTVPSWQQVQYIILNGGAYADYDEAKRVAEDEDTGYTWGYETEDAPTPPPTRTEKPVDETAFRQFLEDVGNYMTYYITDSFDSGLYTADTLASFNLQNTDGGGGATPFTDISEFMDYSMGDMAATVYYALQGEGYYDDDGVTLLNVPSWYEVQHIILEGYYVDYETAKAIAEDEESGYTWGWTTG